MSQHIVQDEPRIFKIRAYSPKQLSELYEVSDKTFKRWLEPFRTRLGERQGRYYNLMQVQCIIEHLGIPGKVVLE